MVWFVMQMCKFVEPLNFDNGKPCIPVIKDHTLPGFMSMDPGLPRGGASRIRIFSGTANPALAQVSFVWDFGSNFLSDSVVSWFDLRLMNVAFFILDEMVSRENWVSNILTYWWNRAALFILFFI